MNEAIISLIDSHFSEYGYQIEVCHWTGLRQHTEDDDIQEYYKKTTGHYWVEGVYMKMKLKNT